MNHDSIPRRRAYSPLPTHMPFGRYKGEPIRLLPGHYLPWAIEVVREPGLKAALRAEDGLRQLAFDQAEGY